MRLLDAVTQFEKHVANPVFRFVAPWAPLFGVIHHRGRTSGKKYATPVTLFANPEAFYVNLGTKRSRDWLKNLAAADGGVVRHRNTDHSVGPAEVRASAEIVLPPLAKAFSKAGGHVAVLPKKN